MIPSPSDLTKHCIACVKEPETEVSRQEAPSKNQIRNQEKKEVLVMENESDRKKTSDREDEEFEDTPKILGDEKKKFQIFDSVSSNSKSPIRIPIEEELLFGEEMLENISSSCMVPRRSFAGTVGCWSRTVSSSRWDAQACYRSQHHQRSEERRLPTGRKGTHSGRCGEEE